MTIAASCDCGKLAFRMHIKIPAQLPANNSEHFSSANGVRFNVGAVLHDCARCADVTLSLER